MKSTPFPCEPYATCEILRPLWFPLVLVQLSAWLSRSPADPALILPISFNKLTQAQTWDSPSYSVPSEGDSDNGRCFVSSSMLLWISRGLGRTLLRVWLETVDVDLHAPCLGSLEGKVRTSACELLPNSGWPDTLHPWGCWVWGGFTVLSSLPILFGVWFGLSAHLQTFELTHSGLECGCGDTLL